MNWFRFLFWCEINVFWGVVYKFSLLMMIGVGAIISEFAILLLLGVEWDSRGSFFFFWFIKFNWCKFKNAWKNCSVIKPWWSSWMFFAFLISSIVNYWAVFTFSFKLLWIFLLELLSLSLFLLIFLVQLFKFSFSLLLKLLFFEVRVLVV